MIFYSTPGSITWGTNETSQVTFFGEWTLEPKFYLDTSSGLFWDGTHPKKFLSESEHTYAIDKLIADAEIKGWTVVADRDLSSNTPH